jgi:hypothetical protein
MTVADGSAESLLPAVKSAEQVRGAASLPTGLPRSSLTSPPASAPAAAANWQLHAPAAARGSVHCTACPGACALRPGCSAPGRQPLRSSLLGPAAPSHLAPAAPAPPAPPCHMRAQDPRLYKLKELLGTNLPAAARLDDAVLLRFLVAEKEDVGAAIRRLASFVAWRQKEGVDDVLRTFSFPEREAFLQLYPQGFHHTDRQGRPVYVQQIGVVNHSALQRLVTDERMLRCAARAGQQQQQQQQQQQGPAFRPPRRRRRPGAGSSPAAHRPPPSAASQARRARRARHPLPAHRLPPPPPPAQVPRPRDGALCARHLPRLLARRGAAHHADAEHHRRQGAQLHGPGQGQAPAGPLHAGALRAGRWLAWAPWVLAAGRRAGRGGHTTLSGACCAPGPLHAAPPAARPRAPATRPPAAQPPAPARLPYARR